jgi:hypothetical protein
MKRKLVALLAISVFLLVTVLSSAPAQAQNAGQWITNYTITDLKTGQVLAVVNAETGQNTINAPVFDGEELNVTVTIKVLTTSQNTNLQLSTEMEHSSQNTYWELHSKDYSGISATNYNPNQQTVTFTQIAGELSISCYGKIASGITVQQAGSITLHIAKPTLLIKQSDPSSQLDKVSVNVVDSKIDAFDKLLTSMQSNLQTMKDNNIDPSYLALFQSIMDSAQAQAEQGLVDSATATLNELSDIQSSAAPSSTNTPLEATLFIPAVAGLAVVLVIFAFLFMRARGKVGYTKLVIEDQIKDLEGLTLRASKIDKNISISLESVKERLKSLVGA